MTDTKAPEPKGSTSRATLDTQINLTPVASQTLLVAVAAAGCLALVCGTVVILAANDAGWVLIGLGVLGISASLWAWFRSQPDVDLQSAAPTVLSMSNGTTLSTDSRTLRNEGAVDAILRIIEANQRKVLPEADGIIEGGVLVPNSAEAARVRTEQINNEVLSQARSLDVGIDGPYDGNAALQRPLEGITPPVEATAHLGHNLPG